MDMLKPTTHEKLQSRSNGHKFGFGSLHARLKGFSRPSRSSQPQDSIVDHDTIDSLLHVPKNILDLPVELIHCICQHLPYDGDACLALTCRQLYYYIGTGIFEMITNARFPLAAFLQKLQKDRPDPNLWLCYGCLRFHSTAHRYDPPNFRALARDDTPGFPYCRSTYAKAIDEIHSRLHSPWTEESKQMHWMEDDITSPFRMSAYISCLGNATDLMLRCRYRFNCRGKYVSVGAGGPGGRMLHILGASNLGICPHVVFASDWSRGDGSVMSVITALRDQQKENYELQDSCHVFQCAECQLDVEVKQQRTNMELIVTVWQYVGRLPPPNVDCNDTSPSKTPHTNDSKRVRPDPKSLPPLTLLLSSKAKRFVLPKAMSSRLESLKKRGPGTQAEQAEVERVPSRLVALLPDRGSMQRQWESLEVEARESSVGVTYTALTVLEDGGQERESSFGIIPV